MRVILRSDVANVGKRGDIVEVSDGYARNFLFPRGVAMKATDGAVAQASSMRRARDLRDAQDKAAAQEIAKALVAKTISIKAKAGPEGRLYGSVTTTEVVAAIADQVGIDLDRRTLHLAEPIKSLGSHSVAVKLHNEVEFPVMIDVVTG
jgi:large subunit ribosomal protein L9